MKILITGHEGFIGKVLFDRLWHKGHELIGLDVKKGDDITKCSLEFTDLDLIIHLAGKSGVRESVNNPGDYWTTNVEGTRRIFERFKKVKILYASSSSAYEPTLNPYAASKFIMEQIAPPNSVGMRFTTVYGPNARESMLIPRILRNDVPYINTNHSRDFIHVDDLVRAIDSLIKSNVKGITDIGSGITNNLIELIEHFGIDCERVVGEHTERLDNLADNTLLNNIGWTPQVNLYEYIKENRNDKRYN